jgi:hypothetical protein
MKKLRGLSVIIFTMILSIMSFSNASAATTNISENQNGITVNYNNDDPQTSTNSSYEEPKNRVFVTEEFAKSQQNNTISPQLDNGLVQPFYGESEVSTVKKTEYYTKTTTPSGQPAGGVRFGTGGGFYVNTSGGYNVSFTIGSSWGPIDYSVSVGYASTGNIGGYFVKAPSTAYYYKAKIDKTIRLRHVLVDHYQYGQYQYSYWTTWKDVYREYVYVVRA